MLSLKRARSIALKEYKHILRDPFTLAVTLLLPLIFVAFFGFVIDLDYKNIRVSVRDDDQSSTSRKFLNELSSSGYFKLTPLQGDLQTEAVLNRNDTASVLIIKKDFGKNILKGDFSNPGRAQLMIDGSDNAKSGILLSYITLAVQKANSVFIKNNPELSELQGAGANPSDLIRTRFLFNPELNSHWFIVPALNTIIIGFLAIVLTALTVAREWENGSMELLLSTPVRPTEIVIGKLFPYFTLTFFDILIVFVLSIFVFKIPFLGSFALFILACCIYIAGALALGLCISVATRVQQTAIQFAFAIGLLPSFIFSGFIFPIENMPVFFRYFTIIFPQRWFLTISRSLFLSDPGVQTMAFPFLAITVFAAVMILTAIKIFKTDVEP
ncbi:ABC transporter related [Elusimicrobium minutum Pei191]|uniref:ABC transporter related n=1 Tax=Elusimicrobium minutum (strain Pei191) TaxID=445932 RepID=B2KDK3_ELUMP|nr:ABC transporter permease [Elusimicrobium minutum]ACC98599.1 ABC transporter related [Elusimicrobium minutum Pei191]